MRKRAEELLIEGHRDRQVVALLERLAHEAEDSSETALFAHRQLAELRLEDSPWRAALHLRRLTTAGVDDDGVYALLGLCHALMGHFRTAVASYRRALRTAANNPWYHHNLGHLLDVGLGDARSALFHLREAHRLEPEEDEVTASLAHCLARMGALGEARALARRAVERAGDNMEHRALLRWIEEGAKDSPGASPRRARVRPGGAVPAVKTPKMMPASKALTPNRSSAKAADSQSIELAVEGLLQARMPDAGFSGTQVMGATALWVDYRRAAELRYGKSAVVAAAIEYAYARLLNKTVTQSSVARRYGVGAGSISSRYRHIVELLNLVPFDPRYATRT